MRTLRPSSVTAGILLMLWSTLACPAQTPADVYQGKSVELEIWFSVGGDYDVYARLLAHHMSKYIPGNPTIVPKNVEGSGSMRLANYLYNAAPHDGTVIGTISRGTVFEPLLGNNGARFDPTKFNWIGATNKEVSVCVAWYTSGVVTIED